MIYGLHWPIASPAVKNPSYFRDMLLGVAGNGGGRLYFKHMGGISCIANAGSGRRPLVHLIRRGSAELSGLLTLLRRCGLVLWALSAYPAFAAVSFHSPTPEQKHRLDQFGYEVFQPSLVKLENDRGEVSQEALVRRFGRPLRRYAVMRRVAAPDSNEQIPPELINWYFHGLALAMSHAADAAGRTRDAPLVILGVSVVSPAYVLQHGLRVGEARSRFLAVLGPPTYQDRRHVRYDVENAARVSPDAYAVEPYQIQMDLDASDKVRRIVWSWWED